MKTTKTNMGGIYRPNWLSYAAWAGMILASSIGISRAQNVTVDQFNNATESAEISAWSCTSTSWGVAAPAPTFSSSDALSSASSGSIEFQIPYGNGAGSDNTKVNCQFNTTAPPSTDFSRATYVEFDLMVDPTSALDPNGNVAYFQYGIGSTKVGEFWLGPWGTAFTPGVWQHIKLPLENPIAGSASGFFINPYQNNFTNDGPNVVKFYMDNIVIDNPAPTYPNFVAFTFDDSNSVTASNAVAGVSGGDDTQATGIGWYGEPTTITWDSNQNSTISNPSITPVAGSGAAHIVAQYDDTALDNGDVIGLFFDTNYMNEVPGSFPPAESNLDDIIDGTHYSEVEMDVLWDTNLSTLSITNFNSMGDIFGMPLGLCVDPGTGQLESMSSEIDIPNAASNGWVHLVFPINKTAGGLDKTIGLWFKKYGSGKNGGFSGTVAYWVDNVVFDGGPIAPPSPPLTIAKPVHGLQLVSTGQSGKNAQYDREDLVTANNAYSFADNPNPITYSMNVAYMPPYNAAASGNNPLARIMLFPLDTGVPGTDTEPDYNYPTTLIMSIQRNSDNSCYVQLQCKTNQAGGNGGLYDPSDPTFNSTTPIGNWSFTITDNTNVFIVAPDGSSTNLAIPLLSHDDVSTWFDRGLGMVAYFGFQNNGSLNEGTRAVLGSASISGSGVPFPAPGGAITYAAVNDNFTVDTNIDVAVSVGDGHAWLIASDATVQTNGIYLIPSSSTLKYFVDWTLPATGFWLQTNGDLTASSAWATNGGYNPLLLATHYHVDVYPTNLPPSGPEFFRLNNAPTK